MGTVPTNNEAEGRATALIPFEKSSEIMRFELQQRVARLFALSGAFNDIKGVPEPQAIALAFVKMELGASMGFTAAESMTGIDFVQGRLAVGAQLRAARMQRAGYDWDILQNDDEGCWLALRRDGKPIVVTAMKDGEEVECQAIVSFTKLDAERAGLLGKDNYKKYRSDMFFARAITRAQRWYAPGVLSLDLSSTEEVISDPVGVSGESKIHTHNLRMGKKAEAIVEDIKAKYKPPQETTTLAQSAEVQQAQSKLEQKRSKRETAPAPAAVVENLDAEPVEKQPGLPMGEW